MSQTVLSPSYMLYKVPITYIVHMFQEYSYNSSIVQVHKLHKFQSLLWISSLRYTPGNGGINGPVPFHRFPLQGQSILSIKICILES